jgi:ADP-ribosylglycohydrolase
MRVAPVGAFFADDLDEVVTQAARSAEVTHSHPEAIAGAIAVAVGAALAWRDRENGPRLSSSEYLDAVLQHTPESEVKRGVQTARDLPLGISVGEVVEELGNGSRVSAQDTVPFVLWCASLHLRSYESALWLTVSGLGDRDTTCAMVGGIVAAGTGSDAIPQQWREAREELPEWVMNS